MLENTDNEQARNLPGLFVVCILIFDRLRWRDLLYGCVILVTCRA